MSDNIFYPKSDCLAVETSSETKTEVVLPEVGEKLRIIINRWGDYQVMTQDTFVHTDSKVIEVEVKAIKTPKVIFE